MPKWGCSFKCMFLHLTMKESPCHVVEGLSVPTANNWTNNNPQQSCTSATLKSSPDGTQHSDWPCHHKHGAVRGARRIYSYLVITCITQSFFLSLICTVLNSDWLRHTPILIFAQFLLYPLYFEQVLKTKYML